MKFHAKQWKFTQPGSFFAPDRALAAAGASVFSYAEGDRLRMLVPRDPAHSDIVNLSATTQRRLRVKVAH